ncbi:MAG TPA: methyltransferase domain-containing protein [Micromonosporaceae bacterium]
MDAGFARGEDRWLARLGTLRQVVRQELVGRQLDAHLADTPPRRILDVGCGQGTQVLRLARRGHQITALDSSPRLLAALRSALDADTVDVRERVRVVRADAADLANHFDRASFDVVLCHGVLMYLPDPAPVLRAIAHVLAQGGVLSLLVRNGNALAMRPGLLGDWTNALSAFDGTQYVNRIGVTARADRLSELAAALAEQGMSMISWYGVRVFTDTRASDAEVPEGQQLNALLTCEERAGRTDPYRAVAALLHVIAQRQ